MNGVKFIIMKEIIISSTLLLLCCNNLNAQDKEGKAKLYDSETGYEVKELQVNDACFNYVLNSRQDTVKIWTKDPKFMTPEKYKVGTLLKEIPQKLQTRIVKVPNLGYALKLDSTLTLFFCEGETCTEPLSKNTTVAWIKREIYTEKN